ncbi:IS66 family transposase zinc-finger binding domain-containing protein [Desulfosporosinus sp. SB140]|uniref:IS66 family transposase zinc-finger binding domain-containing protein n=1 Tax=Desulfosporosinus paludis TaxID=3115649 RepID=UPI00388D2418
MIYLEQELSKLKESEKKLREENEIKQKRIEILEHNVEALTQALLQAAKQRFGASSERTPNSDEQLYLFEEKPEFQSEEEKAPKQTVKAHTRLKRKSGDKARLIADIPREVVECVLSPEEVCDVCSSPLQIIGKKTVRTELEFIPAKLKVLEYVQLIFKCSNCGTTEEYPDAVFKKASVPTVPCLRNKRGMDNVPKVCPSCSPLPSGEGMVAYGHSLNPVNNVKLGDPVCCLLA